MVLKDVPAKFAIYNLSLKAKVSDIYIYEASLPSFALVVFSVQRLESVLLTQFYSIVTGSEINSNHKSAE